MKPLRSLNRSVVLALGAAVALVAGCGLSEDLPRSYGKRQASDGGVSVNGTGVLADMFARRQWRVSTARRLSPKLLARTDCQVIVWSPDEFGPPSTASRVWLENWLRSGHNRKLIYIGRDFDAAPAYWNKVAGDPATSAEVEAEIQQRLLRDQGEYSSQRSSFPKDADAIWFRMRDNPRRKITSLSGRWSADVDPSKAEIELAGLLEPTPADTPGDSRRIHRGNGLRTAEILLSSGPTPLAFSVQSSQFGDGEIVVISNGSWLLNYPLVNHEHRKLAAHLIDYCAESKPGVVFLESGPNGVTVVNTDPAGTSPEGFAMLTVWPLNLMILQAAMAGLVFMFAKYPIFGRPRQLRGESTADFGKHIDALAKLAQRVGDHEMANRWLAYYQQQARRESGVSHRRPDVAPPVSNSLASPVQ